MRERGIKSAEQGRRKRAREDEITARTEPRLEEIGEGWTVEIRDEAEME